jgi:hypothetical protein
MSRQLEQRSAWQYFVIAWDIGERWLDVGERWMEQRRAWQLFVVLWAGEELALLLADMVFAWPVPRSYVVVDFKFITFLCLMGATGATLGTQLRKARRRRDSSPGG